MVDISSEAMDNGRQDAATAIIRAFTTLCNVPRVRRLFDESIPRFSHDAAKNFVAPFVVRLLENYLTTDRVRDFNISKADMIRRINAAARIAVLSNLIGKVPCWNCKSGKDRTGEMDVECKFLSALIARGEPIPEPGARLTDEQKGLFRAIALQGGNFELQKLNVGVAGFMPGSVASIAERLGGKAYHAFHRGGADRIAK